MGDSAADLAVGDAGDVYLCHPFLVHAASYPHTGVVPRKGQAVHTYCMLLSGLCQAAGRPNFGYLFSTIVT